MLVLVLFWAVFVNSLVSSGTETTDNISGTYAVFKGMHYANKTTVEWGHNSQTEWKVTVSFSQACASYNSSSSDVPCSDDAWYGDYNKLWGKSRCGYLHDHHEDSDRFVWRRCMNDADANVPDCIELAAYSYDGGVAPYTGQNPKLLQAFTTTILPNTRITLGMDMHADGNTLFTLYAPFPSPLSYPYSNPNLNPNTNTTRYDAETGTEIETQTTVHDTLCEDNYYEGTVNGLYYGGTCRAPEDVVVEYES